MSSKGDVRVRREVQVRRTGGRLSLPERASLASALGAAAYTVFALLPSTAALAPDVSMVLVAGAAVVLAVAALAPRPDDRTPWLLVTAGLTGTVVARAVAVGAGTLPPGAVLPAHLYADVPWLGPAVVASLAVVVAGVHRLVAGSLSGVRAGQWQDAALVAVVALALAVALLSQRLHDLGLGPGATLAVVARPVAALLVLGVVVAAVVLRGRDRDPRLEVVGLAGAVLAVAEVTAFSWSLVPGPVEAWVEVVVGAARVTSFCLFATAALSAGAPRSRATPSPRVAQLLVIGVLLAAVALVGADHLGLVAPLPPTATTALAVVVLGAGVRLVQLSAEVGGLADARHQLAHDDLTGLLNRRGMTAAARDHVRRGGRSAALVLVDLDAFKDVNDRCGTAVGDEVLRVVARRLERTVRSGLVARLGGDEFALVMAGVAEPDLVELAARALEAVRAPITVADRQLRIGASAGIATTGTAADGTGGEELLRRAELALRRAKSTGGTAVYDEALDAAARLRERLLDDLRTVIESPSGAAGRVVAHYQPQVDADGTVSGVEALVRWEHPELGLLQPFAFIDLAEEHGLLPGLTEQVLRQAVAETARWRALGHPLRCSVNLSASCLDWPRLLDVVDDVLASRLLPADALVLEVTETGLVSDAADGLRVAAELVARGVELSIDDYGTGYSSLAHLNHLPARELKLDRAFTRQLLDDERTATIVRATIALAHDLGMRLVAEGVEDEATLLAITAIGCDVTQGYWHSRPLPASELTGWLVQRSARAITA
ncbi:bifunctional diguanylate cyclase/phosphodiesterase [Quadrisphaera sp. INWT6]|uniref:putative bifunctional diguanylate cyclase/phosphodiesterase n=1 Tax=Quadrisphaera sp. INWT6 TaxID=2596917 RepID=UPI00189210A9|nr:bifunctional diguanylate cyclase/phosphodiesterase [Quadrisphaera sp. INWT6]MBF5082052.1 bifunctional diguanylate cyclase/phosphodiesterase [Quadrisphaera sp. INWT6]